jgi:hypothetical protein
MTANRRSYVDVVTGTVADSYWAWYPLQASRVGIQAIIAVAASTPPCNLIGQ